jgi:uncharacterized protein (DUF1330 family)
VAERLLFADSLVAPQLMDAESFDFEIVGGHTAKGYWVARVDVADVKRYKRYIAADAKPFAKYGARFLVRAGQFQAPEGTSRSRHVVIEYQEAFKLRLPASTADLILVEDYDGPQPT